MQIFFNLQNHPTFHSEERLVNLVRRRECSVGLSILEANLKEAFGETAILFWLRSSSLTDSKSSSMLGGITAGRRGDSCHTYKKDLYRSEGKGRRCCLGDRMNSIPFRACCFPPGRYKEKAEFHQEVWRKGWIHPSIVLVQISYHGKKLNKFCHLKEATTFAFSCVNILLLLLPH